MKFRASLLSIVAGVTGCAGTPGPSTARPVSLPAKPTAQDGGLPRSKCNAAGICLTFALQDDCPNWNAALLVALKKAGCAGLGSEDPKGVECRQRFACDVCRFLENQTWPPAYIRVLPGGKFYLWSPAEGATEIRRTDTPGSLNVAWVEFRKARCFGPGYGIWPFWEDNIEFLAKALLHESLHLCKIVGGYGPSTVDPTTADFVEACF